ncbi:MAG: nicotinate-nucleotide diphosphorylase (carboxylating), partial [Gammaproteobacteria bacterium]|nr:nicotinate-nucleotide diphosphorylase (carboxylating) [Gammaproteobacteria bacterium]
MNYFADLTDTVAKALTEDVGDGDVSSFLVSEDKQARAGVISRQTAIVCGRPWVDEVMRQVDPNIEINWLVDDGDLVQRDDILYQL